MSRKLHFEKHNRNTKQGQIFNVEKNTIFFQNVIKKIFLPFENLFSLSSATIQQRGNYLVYKQN